MNVINWAKAKKSDLHTYLQKRKILSNEKANYVDFKGFIERDMLLLAHSLEKGMGIPNPRIGYGRKKAALLVKNIKKYADIYGVSSFPILESIAVLDKYIALMGEQHVNIDNISEIRKTVSIDCDNYCKAGYNDYVYEDLKAPNSTNFSDLLSSRHSIRHFSREEITEDELKTVIALANRAPSACNRQPIKIYYTKEQVTAREFEQLVDGSHGFQGEIPYYLLVTVDRAYFGNDEFLQWYTNGGIYLGILTLSLHSQDIGSVILQWKYAQQCEIQVKEMFGIKKSEAIVALVGYGKYPKDGTKCIVAQRKSPEDTLKGI